MPYIPQPLKNFKKSNEEILQQDSDYAILVSDINDFIVAQFSNFQKQSIPVIQENYLQRNMIFQQCNQKINQYK